MRSKQFNNFDLPTQCTLYQVFFLFFVLLSLALSVTAAFSQNEISTLERRLNEVEGNQKTDILIQISTSYEGQDDEKALGFAKTAYESAVAAGYQKGIGLTAYHIAQSNFNLKRYEEVTHWAELASEKALELKDYLLAGESWMCSGNSLDRMGNHSEAKQAFESALGAFTQAENNPGIAMANYNLGLLVWEGGDFSAAMAFYQKALEIEELLDNKKQIALILNNMAVILYQWGVPDKALSNYLKSLEIREELGMEKGIPLLLVNIGLIYLGEGQTQKAITFFQEALQKSRKLPSLFDEAYALQNLGVAFEKNNQPDEAFGFFMESKRVSDLDGNMAGQTRALSGLGRVHIMRGEYQDALIRLEEALSLSKSEKNPFFEVLPYKNLGQLYYKLKDFDKALDHLQKSLSISERIGQRQMTMQTLELLSDIYVEQGDFENALKNVRRLMILKEQFGKDVSKVEIASLQSRYEAEKKDKENIVLRSEKSLQNEIIQRQQLIFYLGSLILLLLAGSVIGLVRSMRQKARTHQLLQEAHHETMVRQNQLEEKNEKLEEAMEQVKTLGGLLPICSCCKKIRDDHGYWEQVEVYINKHSGASFTHSICPSCAETYYQQIEDYKAKKKHGKME